MNNADSNPGIGISAMRERTIVCLLSLVAAVHVFVFSAAFPFFNNVDEYAHFDLVLKYSQGQIPRQLEPLSKETTSYIAVYDALEIYLWPSNNCPTEQTPPLWTQPMKKAAPLLVSRQKGWEKVINHEAWQPPLYYALAALWWHGGRWLGLDGGSLLLWVRCLDILLVVALVWLGHITARILFPENLFLRIGVPALLATMPQTTFYSISNDVLSPLCYGVSFILLIRWLQVDVPGVRLGTCVGLALAATDLTKISNLPLLTVSAGIVLFKSYRLAAAGKLRAALPMLAALFFCAVLPMAAWAVWCKYNFGDFTGAGAGAHFFGLTHKPFSEWWHHPIFTPPGLWTFVSGLTATFWRGEILWHRVPLALPTVDWFYVGSSVSLVIAALVALLPRFKQASGRQRQALTLAFLNVAVAVAFLGFLSVICDFHNNFNPSREHPYFTLGRLMLGALIPFLLLYLYGLDRALNRLSLQTKFVALTLLILFMLVSEITADWAVFFSRYNWFHM